MYSYSGTYSKEWSNVHVEAHVGEPRGDDLAPSVVPVLADLRHQDTGATTLTLLELL